MSRTEPDNALGDAMTSQRETDAELDEYARLVGNLKVSEKHDGDALARLRSRQGQGSRPAEDHASKNDGEDQSPQD